MAVFLADPNTWYTLTQDGNLYITPGQDYVTGPHGPVQLGSPTVNVANNSWYQWQFYPVTSPANGTYLLRSKKYHDGWLNSYSPQTLGNATQCTVIGQDCNVGLQLNTYLPKGGVWTFTDTGFGNNTYYITNYPYGTAFRLDVWPKGTFGANEYLRMNSDTTGWQPGQAWQISGVQSINNATLETIDPSLLAFPNANATVPLNITSTDSAGTSTSSISPTSSTAPSTYSTHHGLPAGAIAGIAVGAALIILLTIGFLIWFIRRRRANQCPYPQHSPLTDQSGEVLHYEAEQKVAGARHEEEGVTVPLVEAPAEPAVHELDADGEVGRVGRVERGSEETLTHE